MDLLSRLRPHVPAFLGAVLGAAIIAWLGLLDFGWNDYGVEAAPAYAALVQGKIGTFISLCPAYGGAMVLRAPFALAAHGWGGGELAIYRAVAFPALAGAVALAVWLAAQMRAQGQSLLARGVTVALVSAAPVAERCLDIGHSEELLAAVLAVGAMLFALRRRAFWAGLLLGLAVATKASSLVAVVPVLIALGPRWWRGGLVAAAATAAVLAPLAIGGTAHINATAQGLTQTGGIFKPASGWWFTGGHDHVVIGGDGLPRPGYRTPPAWISPVSHPLIIVLGFAFPLLWLIRRRGAGAPGELLLLLAFTFHLRCLLDPWNIDYYALPMLLFLLCWECLERRRAPVMTLAVTMLLWLIFQRLHYEGHPDVISAIYLAWAVPLAAGMGLRVLGFTNQRREGARPALAAA